MRDDKIVVKNSILLIVSPLILNFISIFVNGLIARKLGKADFGQFVFALTFVTMFGSITNLGLRAITIREIAEDVQHISTFVGKMLVLRCLLAFAAMVLLVVTVNVMGYTPETKMLVYYAALIILFFLSLRHSMTFFRHFK